MGKLKTKKTLKKRVKVTGSGKLITNKTGLRHLKRKWGNSRRFSKLRGNSITTRGIINNIKRLLPGN
jgi:ribosomal protein L35